MKRGKQVAPSVLKENALINRHFYALRSRVEKPKESDDNVGKYLVVKYEFLLRGGVWLVNGIK